MKVVRVPWIRCRADEVGGFYFEMRWRQQTFIVLAYSEGEARKWWDGLSDAERSEVLGLDERSSADQATLF